MDAAASAPSGPAAADVVRDETERHALLTLWLVPGLGPARVRALRRSAGSARAAVAAAGRGWPPLPRAAPHAVRAWERLVDRGRADLELERAARCGVELVTDADPGFPATWDAFDDLPPLLFVRGPLGSSLHDAPTRALAIVGSRRASPAGRSFAADAARACASAGVAVVSGLALGIDAAAHEGALDAGGPTVAVLPGGLDRVAPSSNAALARAIVAAGGALVSEAPIGSAVDRHAFPRRNRLVAALARATLVVEAGPASGANLTAGDAGRYGRDVLVCPARPWDAHMVGNLALLRDGATPVCSLDDLATMLGVARPGRSSAQLPPWAASAAWALEHVGAAGRHPDELVRATGRSAPSVLTALELLVAAGAVEAHADGTYRARPAFAVNAT